jgi:hypothetical protein
MILFAPFLPQMMQEGRDRSRYRICHQFSAGGDFVAQVMNRTLAVEVSLVAELPYQVWQTVERDDLDYEKPNSHIDELNF